VIVFFVALGAAAWLLFGRTGGRDVMWRSRYADEERQAEESSRRRFVSGARGGFPETPWSAARRSRARQRPTAPDDDPDFLSELDERIRRDRRERGN
jgi:hypothetical protein